MTVISSILACIGSLRPLRAAHVLAVALAFSAADVTLANRSWAPDPYSPSSPVPGVAPAEAASLAFSRAALAPPDARIVIHLHRAAELRRALQDHPVGRAVEAFVADPQIAAAWKDLAEGLDLDQMELLDQLLGRDATLVIRGEGPTLEWTLISDVDDATISLLSRTLGPKRLGGGWHHLVRQRIVFNRWQQMAVIGPVPRTALTSEIWSLLRNEGGPRLVNLPALGFVSEMQQPRQTVVNGMESFGELAPFGPETTTLVATPELPRVELLLRGRAPSFSSANPMAAGATAGKGELPLGWTAVVATLRGETIELQQRSLFDAPCLPSLPPSALDCRVLDRLAGAGAVAVLGRSSESPLGAMMLTLLPNVADESIASLVRGVPQLLIVAPSAETDAAAGPPAAAEHTDGRSGPGQTATGSTRVPFALVLEARHSTDEAIRLQEESLQRTRSNADDANDTDAASPESGGTDAAWIEMLEGNLAGAFPIHSAGSAASITDPNRDELLVVAGLDRGRTVIANDVDQLRRLVEELRVRESLGLRSPDSVERAAVCVDAGIIPGRLLAAGLRRASQMHLLDAALAEELASESTVGHGTGPDDGKAMTVARSAIRSQESERDAVGLLASLAEGLHDLRWRLHQIGDRALRLDATFRLARTDGR